MDGITEHRGLLAYQAKRNFARTPEPGAVPTASGQHLAFVVQKHWARHLHYDFRLEWGGTLKSWAVPKGPSLDPRQKRMAIEVEDHPVAYARFEGVIPPQQYGAGKVIVWDHGLWQPLMDVDAGLRQGELKFELHGHKLAGRWVLVRTKGGASRQTAWLLIKEKDSFARAASDFDVVSALPATPPLPLQAVPAELPASLRPALATLVDVPPVEEAGQGWSFEIKLDGYRMLARVDGDRVALFTRSGLDWSAKLPALVRSLQQARLPPGWYDGELVLPDDKGVPDFAGLQQRLEARQTDDLLLHLFDLPFVAGHDLRAAPLQARKQVLQGLLANAATDRLRYTPAFDVDGASVVASACRMGLEGVIGKRQGSPYPDGRSGDWIKLKCTQRQEFVIVGYTDPKGSRGGFGALLLAVFSGSGELRYVGDVGSGFSQAQLASVLARLKPLARATPPLPGVPARAARVHWVRAEALAEVSFANWTRAGRIRHAVFHALRSDKPAREVVRERPTPSNTFAQTARAGNAGSGHRGDTGAGGGISAGDVQGDRPTAPAGVTLTHPQRIVDAQSGTSKAALVAYYQRVAPLLMWHLKGRPLAWVRAPAGIAGAQFFQKHLQMGARKSNLTGVRQLAPAMMEIVQPTGLVHAAQWNVIEFHSTNGRTGPIDRPDRLVFDLDPGADLSWNDVQEAAELMRLFLAQLGLNAFLKTSGGKGLHVVVPVLRLHSWAAARGFSQAVVRHMAHTVPQRFVARSGPRNRVGKIFIDYLRNAAGATTVAAWSARARPGMGISVPVAWEELPMLSGGDQWTVATADERLDAGNAPWDGYARAARSLKPAMQLLGYRPPPELEPEQGMNPSRPESLPTRAATAGKAR